MQDRKHRAANHRSARVLAQHGDAAQWHSGGWVSGIEWRDAVAAKFVLKKGSTGKFHFNLIATNGQVIATSEAYESKAAALNGIESVKRNAPVADVDDQTTQ
jgi:uncharacterized protein YegP (UPF0339 family)